MFGCTDSHPSATTSDDSVEDKESPGKSSDPKSSNNKPQPKKPNEDPEKSPKISKNNKGPGIDPSTKLEGLNLDLNQLLNYQAQDFPIYIFHDNTLDENPITDKGATLGRVLFYDPRLSTNNKISCASCHQQKYAFGDQRPLSDGVNGKTLRHSMRLVNIRFSEDMQVRWDRKADSVETQMLMPIQDHAEMGYSGKNGNPNLDDLIKKLQAIKAYKVLFHLAWGDPKVSRERIAMALAQFVRSIQSFDSKYDTGREQVSHDWEPFPNFTDDENAGKSLFFRDFDFELRTITAQIKGKEKQEFEVSQRISGGFNCIACHRAPEFDIDPRSRNNGLTQAANPIGPKPADYEAVRSASLRDLINPSGSLNGGLFHTGQVMDLSGIADHYEFQPPDENNYLLDRRFTRSDRPIHLNITKLEERQLIAFLKTLSGRQLYTDERWSNPFISGHEANEPEDRPTAAVH